MKHWRIYLLAAAISCNSGCQNPEALPPFSSAERQEFIKLAPEEVLKIQPGDKLRLIKDGSTQGIDLLVDPSGYVSIPNTGNVKAANLTRVEFERTLNQRFFRGKATVEVVSFGQIFVSGEVKNPGAYAYVAGINIFKAIALAGGRTYRASRDQVLIQHRNDSSLREYPLTADTPVIPGDLIYVPMRYF